MNRLGFFIICLCLVASLDHLVYGIDYEICQSIEEVILKETDEIIYAHPADYSRLSELYVSRGESYLLNAEFEKAVDDFQKAYSYLISSQNSEIFIAVAFRVAFGEMVSYDNLGMQARAEQALQQLQTIVNYFECGNCVKSQLMDRISLNSCERFSDKCIDLSLITVAAVDPNQPQSSWWCEQTVKNTSAVLRGIAANIPSRVIRFSAMELIKSLEEKAINCCYAGGLWSACVKPLADKFEQWNRKWKMFGIPPDPSWDSDIR